MELTPDILLRAYAIGIFPMAEGREHSELHWIDPEHRGVLPLEEFHIPRKLRRRIRRAVAASSGAVLSISSAFASYAA